MSLATYYLDFGRHVARLRRRRRRRRRRRAYAPTSNTASHDNHEKISSWVSFAFLYVFEYGAPLGGPWGRRSSAINQVLRFTRHLLFDFSHFPSVVKCVVCSFIINVWALIMNEQTAHLTTLGKCEKSNSK